MSKVSFLILSAGCPVSDRLLLDCWLVVSATPSLFKFEMSCCARKVVIAILSLLSESQGNERGVKVTYSGEAREGRIG